jgi:hypothetical protein
MEEKYSELKAAGKSENEAIGTVIAEFGNIEELVEEIGAARAEYDVKNDLPEIDLSIVQGFLEQLRATSIKTGIGIWVILSGVALLLRMFVAADLFTSGTDTHIFNITVGIVSSTVMLAAGIGTLAFAWLKILKYEFITREFKMPEHVRQYVHNVREKVMGRNVTFIAVGVTIIVLSTMAVIIPVIVYGSVNPILNGVAIFLVAVGIGTMPIVIAGLSIASFAQLLGIKNEDDWFSGVYIGPKGIHIENELHIDNNGIRIGNNPKESISMKGIRIIGVISAVFWPLVVAAYLLWSFVTGAWHISWIVFPIAGLIFGAISGGIGAYYSLGERKK